jgi:hypothetical protein
MRAAKMEPSCMNRDRLIDAYKSLSSERVSRKNGGKIANHRRIFSGRVNSDKPRKSGRLNLFGMPAVL